MTFIKIGSKSYSVIQTEDAAVKYPNIAKLGWKSIITASLGETIFCIYQHSNGNTKIIRAFV